MTRSAYVPTAGQTCPGTDRDVGGFPGDEATCPVCEEWVVVNAFGCLRKHKILVRAEPIVAKNLERHEQMWGGSR